MSKTTAVDESKLLGTPATPEPTTPESEMVQISKQQWEETQKMLKMLYETADKGRIFNYENQGATKKPLRVKLSVFRDGLIIGWRTIKDVAVYHPTTGKQVGEDQEYEVLVLAGDGKITPVSLHGYSSFNDARYTERVECEVTGRKEDNKGNWSFDVQLPDGRTVALDTRFVN